jgi:hypothetical protein
MGVPSPPPPDLCAFPRDPPQSSFGDERFIDAAGRSSDVAFVQETTRSWGSR